MTGPRIAGSNHRVPLKVTASVAVPLIEAAHAQDVTVTLLMWDVDDGLVLNLPPTWAPEAAVRKKILVDNPAQLYKF